MYLGQNNFFPVSNPCGIFPALITQHNIYVKKIAFVTGAVDSCNTTCFVEEKSHIFIIKQIMQDVVLMSAKILHPSHYY